jgi:hypothetical protein
MWDDEIDRAAERLTSGEPDGELKARVLNRIEARRPRTTVSGWVKIALPIGALMIGFVVIQRVQRVQRVQTVQEVQGVQGVQEVQEVYKVQTVQPVPPPRTLAPAMPAHLNPTNLVQTVDDVRAASRVETLSPMDIPPLVIAAPVVDAIPPPERMVIDRLTVPPIEVPAYDAPPEELAQ